MRCFGPVAFLRQCRTIPLHQLARRHLASAALEDGSQALARRCSVILSAGVVLFTGLGCVSVEPNTETGLYVEAWVSPRTVSLSRASDAVAVRVRVTNTKDIPLSVAIGPGPCPILAHPATSHCYLYQIRFANSADSIGAGPAADALPSAPVWTIPARTTFHHDFEPLVMGPWRGGWDVTPGRYRVRAYFNGSEGREAFFYVVR